MPKVHLSIDVFRGRDLKEVIKLYQVINFNRLKTTLILTFMDNVMPNITTKRGVIALFIGENKEDSII
jgi:hypothetical protein